MDVSGVSKRVDKEALAPLRHKHVSSENIDLATDAALLEQSGDSYKPNNASSAEFRQKINNVITAVNLTTEASGEIESALQNVKVLVEKAGQPGIERKEKVRLEEQANQLIKAIEANAEKAGKQALNGLEQEPLASAIENQLRKTLEVLLPKGPGQGFGVGSIKLYPPEVILATRARIEEATRRIEALRDTVRESKAALKDFVQSSEVAQQNAEAANPSVRDLETALQKADQTRLSISQDPEKAINSFGGPGPATAKLLVSGGE